MTAAERRAFLQDLTRRVTVAQDGTVDIEWR
jgi:hypothetical protein